MRKIQHQAFPEAESDHRQILRGKKTQQHQHWPQERAKLHEQHLGRQLHEWLNHVCEQDESQPLDRWPKPFIVSFWLQAGCLKAPCARRHAQN